MTQLLTEKYRPSKLEDLVFINDEYENKFRSWVQNKFIDSHLLLYGHPGTGKSSIFISGIILDNSSMKRSPLIKPLELKEKSAICHMKRRVQRENHRPHSSIVPVAYIAPTKAPIELPVTEDISKPCPNNSLITPIWANPRAPPMDRTKSILGLLMRFFRLPSST